MVKMHKKANFYAFCLHFCIFCCTFAVANLRRGVCTSLAGGADILKWRLLALCSDESKCRKFRKKNQDLATIDVLRDMKCPSCAYWVRFLRIYVCATRTTIT